jgi:hypothetical protein
MELAWRLEDEQQAPVLPFDFDPFVSEQLPVELHRRVQQAATRCGHAQHR